MTQSPPKAPKRDIVIDLLKTIAILGVLTIHASTAANGAPIGSFNWFSGTFFGCLTRASVPLFLMCSGALFLSDGKDISIKKLFTKNILRLVVSMIFWATAYKAYNLLETHNFSIANLFSDFKNVLFFKQEFHLYYIHIMLLIYAILPIISLICKNADKRTLQYALVIWFALGVLLPTLTAFWPFSMLSGIPHQWKLNLVYNSVGYFIFGHYLKKYPLKLPLSIISAILGFAIIFGGTVYFTIKNGTLYTLFIDGMTLGSFFLSAGIFGLCENAKALIKPPIQRITEYVSKASFCIYLVHMLVLYEMEDLKFSAGTLPIPMLISIPIVVIVCFAVSTAIYFILSHIPVIKKWLV
ncbi:MAG: acyltransferase family protein [Clostridia bacterium]|nr:acyltransferase family protein [Clostridia bacterium]